VADVPLLLHFIGALADYEKLRHRVQATPELLEMHLFGASPRAEAIIAELDGVPRGFALFFHNFSTFQARPGLYLEDLYVEPQARSRGLGRLLLSHLAKVAFERRCARMEWMVLDWNTPALDFYRSVGAVPQDGWTTQRLEGEALQRLARSAS
jgi:GNAT superfamily N-acetyltransferase